MRGGLYLATVTIALAAGLAPAGAQVRTAYPEKRGLALSQFPRTIKLPDNVYGYEEIRQPGFTTVSLFVPRDNWGPYAEWFLGDQQAPIAIRKVDEELEGKLK
jgi:hypothetical protein